MNLPATPASDGGRAPPSVAVITMVRDEAEMLPRWLAHYGGQLGMANLIVLDDNSTDGSTDDLGCTCYRLPPAPWKAGWGSTRRRLVNGMAAGLLACNDAVIYTDVDEFLVPDPDRYAGLPDYLRAHSERDVLAPLAVEVVQNPRLEAPLDPALGVLRQRRFVKCAPAMCKPVLKRTNAKWRSGFHASTSPFEIDPFLWLFHLKFADEQLLRKSSTKREHLHRTESRGHPASFWAMPADHVVDKLAEWTEGADDVPEFDPAEIDLDDLVRQDANGNWLTKGAQVEALDSMPLRRVPQRFRSSL